MSLSTPLLSTFIRPNYVPDKILAGAGVAVSLGSAVYTALSANWWTAGTTTVSCILSMALFGRLWYHSAQPVPELVGVTVQSEDETVPAIQLIADKVRALLQKTTLEDEEPKQCNSVLEALDQIADFLDQLQKYAIEDEYTIKLFNTILAESDAKIEELQTALNEMQNAKTASPDQWDKIQGLLTELSNSSKSAASLPGTPSTPANPRARKQFTGTPKRLEFGALLQNDTTIIS